MDFNEFNLLEDSVYEFITYMDEKIVGIPFSDDNNTLRECYVIPPLKMNEFNESTLSIVERLELGQLIPINPDVIDETNKIS